MKQAQIRQSFYKLTALLVPGIILPLLLSGCGTTNLLNTKTPPAVTIAASPTSVQAGTASTLTVTATDASSVTVTGSDGSSYTMTATGGTQQVTPSKTTTYTATASGVSGTTAANATATVTVTPSPVLAVTITASPTSILLGTSSTLTVVANNATAVTVSGSDGSSYTLTSSGGTKTVSPTTTTTYTATATGATGTTPVTATATVTVTYPPPAVTLTANPTSVPLGSSSTLTAVATNATGVIITGSDGSTYTLSATGGTQLVSPTATTTYTAKATGQTGTTPATATAQVTVTAPPPTAAITASPNPIVAGNSSTLTVTFTNASTVTVTGGASPISLPATSSPQTVQVSPTTTTAYTATVVGPGGTKSATVTLTVTPAPPPTITITPTATSTPYGTPVTLTITATGATSVTLTSPTDPGPYTVPSNTGGPVSVNPTTTSTYTATATGLGGTNTAQSTVTVVPNPPPTVTITPNTTSINLGGTITMTIAATHSTSVAVTANPGTSDTNTYPPLTGSGTINGTVMVTPTASGTLTYTATATGLPGTTPATATTATITVGPAGSVQDIQHVIFMLQENHTFDNYFGMLNPYRKGLTPANAQVWNIGDDGNTYNVDGIDDKLTTISNKSDEGDVFKLFRLRTSCIDDDSSDWLASFGDVNRYYTHSDRNQTTGTNHILMDGFVHTAEGYANSCIAGNSCSGTFNDDLHGQRAMGYYDQSFLNYYYFMASEFALSDRWFSPVASKSITNRIATFAGGTTQGLVHDPGSEDHLNQLPIPTIFGKLTNASATWKIYYSATAGFCKANGAGDECYDKNGHNPPALQYPATDFENFQESFNYIQENPTAAACSSLTIPPNINPNFVGSSAVGDTSNSFCIDPTHIAPLTQYYTDLQNNTLPQFAFIEAGYGIYDEHPGSGQPVLAGQYQMAQIINAWMATAGTSNDSYSNSVFFFAYDEGGGPYDHVPPVPGHSNQNTIVANMGTLPSGGILDIAANNTVSANGIVVAPDSFIPNTLASCPYVPPQYASAYHCDLGNSDPGSVSGDIANTDGFTAQLGFRIPNFIISPFARRHYVSHTPIDHTAIIKFVEDRFIGDHNYLTARDAAQPSLTEFFDFNNIPWSTPPQTPAPLTDPTHLLCNPSQIP